MNGEDLTLKLKETVNERDEVVKAAKARETEHEKLVGGLISEAERVNEIILGKNVSYLSFVWFTVFLALTLLAWLAGFYPEADERVQQAVASAHVQPESSCAAAGALPSAALRLQQFSPEFIELRNAAGGVLENLWPDTPLPTTLGELSSRLDGAPAGIDEQLELAARGGSDMAFALVKSWYPEVQVDMLVDGFRTGTTLESLCPEICMASEQISKAVDLVNLVPAEPSSASRPTEDAEAGNTTATNDAAP